MKAPPQALLAQAAHWCQDTADGVQLQVYVQPNAKTTEVAGEFNGALKIRLKAQPVDGKANQTLLKWVSERLNVPKHAMHLETGHTNRYKQIRIAAAGLNAKTVRDALLSNT